MKRRVELLIVPFITFIILSFSSCDSTIKYACGEPTGERKELIDSLNNSYKGILVAKEVPCYPGYFQIDLEARVDSVTVDILETFIENGHYTEVLIYDESNKLIRGETGSM